MAQTLNRSRRRLPAELVRAYLSAWYVAEPTEAFPRSVMFRVGLGSQALANRLAGHDRGGFITACHPHGKPQPYPEECADRLALGGAIAACGLASQPATGRDPKGSFPAEPGYLVLGADCEQLATWARAYGQDAFLSIESDHETGTARARLVLLYPVEMRPTDEFQTWCASARSHPRASRCTVKEQVRLSLMDEDTRKAILAKPGPVKMSALRLIRTAHQPPLDRRRNEI